MDALPIEDERGVDIGQIRAQLRLPVKDRVRVMVEASNAMMRMQEHARRIPAASSRFGQRSQRLPYERLAVVGEYLDVVIASKRGAGARVGDPALRRLESLRATIRRDAE